GEVFRGDGLIIAGKSASAGASALSRPRQKRELTEALTASSAQIESLNNDVNLLSMRITDAQHAATVAENVVREVRVRLDQAEGFEKQAGLESESARRELEWQKSQRVQLQAEADEAASIRRNLIQSQTEIEAESAKAHEDARLLSSQFNEADLQEVQGQASYWSTRVAVSERALADARARQAERHKEAEKFDSRSFELSTRLTEAETSLTDLDTNKAAFHEREGALREQIEALRVYVDPAEKDLETAEAEE